MNPEGLYFSDGEMAWTSFNKAIRKFSRRNAIDGKIHPTQKPIELYDWILRNYSNGNEYILDTHLGSASSAIAVEKTNRLDHKNLSFDGVEIDVKYHKMAIKRFEIYKNQQSIMF